MNHSEEITLKIIKLLYPEWIAKEKDKYAGISEYQQYVSVLRDVFHYDIELASVEQDRALDLTELERRLEIMKLNSELRQAAKKESKKEIKK